MEKEGKTTVSETFAKIAAASGQRTIHINCDLRRGNTYSRRLAGSDQRPGLADVLSGHTLTEDAVMTDAATGCQFLGSGVFEGSPADLLRSTRMRNLVALLSLDYQLIVLDSPPVTVASDALILSLLADATIYLVRWAHTSRETALSGFKDLYSVGGNVSGVMLTRADTRKFKDYEETAVGMYSRLRAS